jgi:peptidoglycan-associated lipoprotein
MEIQTMKHLESSIVALAVSALLAACSSTPVDPASTARTSPAANTTPSAPSPPAAAGPAPASTVTSVVLPPHKDPKNAISTERSVYFEYDDFAVNGRYAGIVERHGKYLQTHPALTVRLEGNADERGSAEYNLALGQKRAEAVLRALKLLGVKDSQMEAVSFGEERPRVAGHDEGAWSENRRADISYRN